MISRVADHCFWLGRYVERAEATARLLFVTRNYLELDAGLTARQCWMPVVIVSGEEPSFLERYGPQAADDAEAIQHYMTWDEGNLSCIARSISAARENARSIREVLSSEVWETINELHLWVTSEAAKAEYAHHRYGYYRRVRQACQLLAGLLRSTMLHDAPLHFITLGVLLERVSQTARVVDVHHHALTLIARTNQVVETALWLAMLRVCSGFEPFMKRNQGAVTGDAVASFLVFEPRFPKSVAYGVHAAHERFAAIRRPDEPEGLDRTGMLLAMPGFTPAGRDLPGAETQRRLARLDAWIQESASSMDPGGIHALLTHVVDETAAICESLGREMLGYGPPAIAESPQ